MRSAPGRSPFSRAISSLRTAGTRRMSLFAPPAASSPNPMIESGPATARNVTPPWPSQALPNGIIVFALIAVRRTSIPFQRTGLQDIACLPLSIIAAVANHPTKAGFSRSPMTMTCHCLLKLNLEWGGRTPGLFPTTPSLKGMSPAGFIAGDTAITDKCLMPGNCWGWS